MYIKNTATNSTLVSSLSRGVLGSVFVWCSHPGHWLRYLFRVKAAEKTQHQGALSGASGAALPIWF